MPYGQKRIFYVGEVGPAAAFSRDVPKLGPRVSIVDHQGKLIGRLDETPVGTELGELLVLHGLAVASHGYVYIGEVSWTARPPIYRDTHLTTSAHCRSSQKNLAVCAMSLAGVPHSDRKRARTDSAAWTATPGRILSVAARFPLNETAAAHKTVEASLLSLGVEGGAVNVDHRADRGGARSDRSRDRSGAAVGRGETWA